MAKKKGLNLGKILVLVSIVLGVVALVMLVAPGFAPKSDASKLGIESVALFKVVFGNSDSGLAFSFPLFLGVLLIVAGVVCSVLALLGKGGKIVSLVAAICFVAGGVLYFCTMGVYAVKVNDKLSGDLKDAAVKAAKEIVNATYNLGIGAILGGILSILAGVAVVVPVFLKK